MEARGIQTYFRYTPPMNEVFQHELPPSDHLDSEAVTYWCASILPVDLRFSHQYLEACEALCSI